jgi:RimJ/RimL family protein N-acetyltransferase
LIDLPPDLALLVETSRLRLIPLAIDGAEDLFPVLNDERLHEFTGEGHKTADEFEEWIELGRRRRSVDGSAVFLTWVIRLVPSEQPLGYCQATIHDDASADVHIVVGTHYAGHGVATEAVDGMVRALRGPLGVGELRVHIHPENHVAQQLFARAGLHCSGMVDPVGDEVWFSPRPD